MTTIPEPVRTLERVAGHEVRVRVLVFTAYSGYVVYRGKATRTGPSRWHVAPAAGGGDGVYFDEVNLVHVAVRDAAPGEKVLVVYTPPAGVGDPSARVSEFFYGILTDPQPLAGDTHPGLLHVTAEVPEYTGRYDRLVVLPLVP
jgi:hypothetical protein